MKAIQKRLFLGGGDTEKCFISFVFFYKIRPNCFQTKCYEEYFLLPSLSIGKHRLFYILLKITANQKTKGPFFFISSFRLWTQEVKSSTKISDAAFLLVRNSVLFNNFFSLYIYIKLVLCHKKLKMARGGCFSLMFRPSLHTYI